jgi:predicted transport protein
MLGVEVGEIKLFKIDHNEVKEIVGESVALEKSLQNTIEKNLNEFLSVRFLATEYSTGKTHGGRIDTLGIDENGCPVIIEYKRSLNENVINQGLFYLNWLLDHKAEFELLVMKKLGNNQAEEIAWNSPRLICIAGDFTRYDEHAVQEINKNIELVRYRRFGHDLLLFELINASIVETELDYKPTKGNTTYKVVTEDLEASSPEIQDLFEELKAFILALGDDIQFRPMKYYFVFKRLANFACVEIFPKARKLVVFVKVDPSKVELQEHFLRDVREIGHYGTGDLEITIKSKEDLQKAKQLLIQSYDAS